MRRAGILLTVDGHIERSFTVRGQNDSKKGLRAQNRVRPGVKAYSCAPLHAIEALIGEHNARVFDPCSEIASPAGALRAAHFKDVCEISSEMQGETDIHLCQAEILKVQALETG